MGKTYRHNKGDTPTVCRKNTTEIEISNTFASSIQTERSRKKFLMMTNMDPGMTLETLCMNDNVEETSPQKVTLKPTASSPVAVDESVGNASYTVDSL